MKPLLVRPNMLVVVIALAWSACLAFRPKTSIRLPTALSADLVSLEAPKAAFLVGRWKNSVENDVALGHLPQHTHPHRDVAQLMKSSRAFKDIYASCSALAVASKASSPVPGTLRNATIFGTPRSSLGAAIAVLVENEQYVNILHVAVNPESRTVAKAEVEIIAAIAEDNDKPARLTIQARDALRASDAELDIDRVEDRWVYLSPP